MYVSAGYYRGTGRARHAPLCAPLSATYSCLWLCARLVLHPQSADEAGNSTYSSVCCFVDAATNNVTDAQALLATLQADVSAFGSPSDLDSLCSRQAAYTSTVDILYMVGALIFIVDSIMYFISGLQCRHPEMEEPAHKLSRRMSVKVVYKSEYEQLRSRSPSTGSDATEMRQLPASPAGQYQVRSVVLTS